MESGKTIARSKDDPTLANMEQRASQLRAKLREQDRNFTADYIALDPTARAERAQLAELEEQIKEQRITSQQMALSEAQDPELGAEGVHVGAADAHRVDAQNNFTRNQVGFRAVLDLDFEGLGVDKCFHGVCSESGCGVKGWAQAVQGC
jgi:hypothetical protein